MTSSWFFLSTLNYDARSTTHQIYDIRIKSAHDTGTGTGGHQPRSCSHQNHLVYLNMATARLLTNCSNTLRNIHTKARENITRTRAKRKAGNFFVAYLVLEFLACSLDVKRCVLDPFLYTFKYLLFRG